MRRRITYLSLLCALTVLAWPSHATVIVEHDGPTPRGIRIESTDIEIDVQEGAASLRVHQTLRNTTGATLEARYVLPIPRGARATSAALRIGEQWVEAEILEADQARHSYEEIVRKMIDPALIEHLDDGMLRTRVFPIPAHGTREIELQLGMTLPMEFDAWELRLPLAALCGESQIQLRGNVHSDEELLVPYSPTHDLNARLSRDTHGAEFDWSGTQNSTSNLTVVLPFAAREFGVFAASTKPAGEDGFVLLRVAPGQGLGGSERLAKDLIFVLDTSGSMRGAKIAQAKRALSSCLEQLGPDDRFAVISYAAQVHALNTQLESVSSHALEETRRALDRLRADGGTNIGGALEEALRIGEGFRTGRARYVLFLTDGLPTVGEQNIRTLLDRLQARGDALPRIFSFGVGHDVNTQLLDGIAQISRASARYVLPGEDLETSIGRLNAQIAEPLWTDLELELQGAGLYDMIPGELGDLFAGQAITVLARYRDPGRHTLRLRGLRGERRERFETGVQLHAGFGDASYIPQLWAAKKIALLERAYRDEPQRHELRDEIVQLATRYGILTRYTSLLMREADPALASAMRREDFDEARERVRALSSPGEMEKNEAPPAVAGRRAAESAALNQRILVSDSVAGMDSKLQRDSEVDAPERAQRIGKRYFEQKKDGVWVDRLAEGTDAKLTVALHSEAYFELLSLRPDLRAMIGAHEEIRIALGGSVLAVAKEGVRELTREDRAWLRTARL